MTVGSSGKAVVIVGITGTQGGSVLKALQNSKQSYKVKGLTRDASKPAAKALADQGVEIVSQAITADNADELAKVFKGADVVFGVTQFWEHYDRKRETAEGSAIADAVKKAGVPLFVFSGLPNYAKLTNGKYTHVEHFDGKADVVEYAKSIGVNTIDVQAAFYFQNLTSISAPRKQDDGTFVYFTLQGFGASKVIAVDAAEDYGKFVQAAIEGGYKGGDTVLAASDSFTGKEMIDELAKASGKTVNIVEVPFDAFVGALSGAMGPVVADEFGQMLATQYEFTYYGKEQWDRDHKNLSNKTTSWKEFVSTVDWSKILA